MEDHESNKLNRISSPYMTSDVKFIGEQLTHRSLCETVV